MGLEKLHDLEKVMACFERTVLRGPDMSRTLPVGDGLLCFHRLAIMGLTERGMQPFIYDGDAVVCNGELYGFRAMKE
jgi:asparagine synthase (glutamine-hydrolysing)